MKVATIINWTNISIEEEQNTFNVTKVIIYVQYS